MITVRQNDTLPPIEAVLKDGNGDVLDLTEADHVQFKMMNQADGSTKVDRVAVIEDRPGGQVQFNWATGDLDTVGTYKFEFEITYNDAGILSVPNDGFEELKVSDEI